MKIKPLNDRVLLKPLKAEEKTKGGIILPESAKEKPQEAKVVAVGKGKIVDGKRQEMSVKEGDIVIYSKYAGDDIKIDDEEYTLIEEDKILAIVEK
jgi:chaperonin GroES